ncbi:hypothetical protein QNN88_01930 [Citrobacter sp. ANG330]|uniref:hypothetical protein n=1 Tax=Citrobacter sp. ANG330 TaxID=3048142 RepID=UPI0039C23E13
MKTDRFGLCRGEMKCPYNCRRVGLESPAGSRNAALEKLQQNWCGLVEKLREDKNDDSQKSGH